MRSSSIAGLALLLAVSPLPAQTGMLLEVTGHAGYAAVDIDKWYGSAADDWTQFSSGASAKLFLKSLPTIKLGVEVGYRYFAWYQVTIPFGTTTITRDYDISATHYALVARFGPPAAGFAFDVGVGGFAFDGGTDMGGHAAISKSFLSGPKISIPIGLRLDYVMDPDAPITNIGATAGIAVKF